jgi:hypothetical protein
MAADRDQAQGLGTVRAERLLDIALLRILSVDQRCAGIGGRF